MNKHLTFLSALALTTGLSLQAQNVNQMVIQANKIGAEIQPTMYLSLIHISEPTRH